jgi:hypothetical protein
VCLPDGNRHRKLSCIFQVTSILIPILLKVRSWTCSIALAVSWLKSSARTLTIHSRTDTKIQRILIIFQLHTSPVTGLASVICLQCLLCVWVLLTKVYGPIDTMNPSTHTYTLCVPSQPTCSDMSTPGTGLSNLPDALQPWRYTDLSLHYCHLSVIIQVNFRRSQDILRGFIRNNFRCLWSQWHKLKAVCIPLYLYKF